MTLPFFNSVIMFYIVINEEWILNYYYYYNKNTKMDNTKWSSDMIGNVLFQSI